MRRTTTRRPTTCLAFVLLATLAGRAAPAAETAAAYEWVKGLAGTWTGSYEWSGGRTGGGAMSAEYYTTGRGSSVVENLTVGGEPIMTSVYHLDGGDLRMTHFCGAGNQPRLAAVAVDERERVVRFEKIDVTNLASPAAGHVHRAALSLPEPDRLVVTYVFLERGEESTETITLRRVAD